MKTKRVFLGLFLGLWALGILFPMAWFTGLNPASSAWFHLIFKEQWMHILFHSMLYAVLASGCWIFLGRLSKRGLSRFLWTAGIIGAVALLQESLQNLAGIMAGYGLGADEWFDMRVDVCGALLGVGITCAGGWLLSKIRDSRNVDKSGLNPL